MEIEKVAAALVVAQKAFGPALKDRVNPAFKSRYADLASCLDAVMDALNAAGIALVQRQHPCDGGVSVETLFVHESGQILSGGILSVPASKQDPQGYGSALTYARRYSLMSACGIAPEDDDGNAAAGQRPPAQPPKPTPAQKPIPAPAEVAAQIVKAHAAGRLTAAQIAERLHITAETDGERASLIFEALPEALQGPVDAAMTGGVK